MFFKLISEFFSLTHSRDKSITIKVYEQNTNLYDNRIERKKLKKFSRFFLYLVWFLPRDLLSIFKYVANVLTVEAVDAISIRQQSKAERRDYLNIYIYGNRKFSHIKIYLNNRKVETSC